MIPKNIISMGVVTLFVLILTFVGLSSAFQRQIPTSTGSMRKFYLKTSVGPYYDVIHDLRADEYIRQKNLLEIQNIERKLTFDRESNNLERGDGTYGKNAYVKIVKYPTRKGNVSQTIADWFLFHKGSPVSLFAICMLGLPILFAGFIQMMITARRKKKSKISRRTWEFPLVPVLMLQQTRREYLLRKKTVRRFCIQWEVGRINIRMNTRLVDLRQILHPPTKKKKTHKYTTWRIIRLICRFNAFLAMKKKAEQRSEEQLTALQKARVETWKHKINTSRYLLETRLFREALDSKEKVKAGHGGGGQAITTPLLRLPVQQDVDENGQIVDNNGVSRGGGGTGRRKKRNKLQKNNNKIPVDTIVNRKP